MLAAGGALNHLGIKHYRVAGDFHEPAVLNKLLAYARCGAVVTQLNGQKYGLIGGQGARQQRQFPGLVDGIDISGRETSSGQPVEGLQLAGLEPLQVAFEPGNG